jgi:hypothetical protein
MKETYTIKYRQPGQWFWRTIKNVKGEGFQGGFWFVLCEDDSMHYFSGNAEIYFPPERNAILALKESRKTGQQIPRA